MPKSLRKIVSDSSALISLAHGQVLALMLGEFRVVTSNWAVKELEETAKFSDPDGQAARTVLAHLDLLTVVEIPEDDFRDYLARRVHAGEASCLALARQQKADALICDDFDALPYLEHYCKQLGVEVGLCSALIQALILRGKLTKDEGRAAFDRIAGRRNWLGRPLYEYGKSLLK